MNTSGNFSSPGSRLWLAGAVVVLSGMGLGRLEIATDGQALVPANHPATREDRELRTRFDHRESVAIVLRPNAEISVWNRDTLGAVVAVSEAVEGLAGVRPGDVFSLATAPGFPTTTSDGRPRLGPLVARAPVTAEEIASLRRDFDRIALWRGLLVSQDDRAAAIYLGVPDEGDRRALVRDVTSAVAGKAPGHSIEVVGAPVAAALLGDAILVDLGVPPAWAGLGTLDQVALGTEDPLRPPLGTGSRFRVGLVPVVFVVMAGVLWATFGRLFAAAVPLIKVAGTLITTFGWMGWTGTPIYLTTVILPVVLTAVGITDEIHLLRRLRRLAVLRPTASNTELVAAALGDLAAPIRHTSFTTAAGFASFAFSAVGPQRSFGLWAALGVGLCLVWALWVTPALLTLAPRRWWAAGAFHRRVDERLGRAIRRNVLLGPARSWAIAVVAVVVLLSLVGIGRLTVQDSWLDAFDPASPFARAAHRLDHEFLGTHQLLLEVSVPPVNYRGDLAVEAALAEPLCLPTTELAGQEVTGAWLWLSQRRAGELREWSGWVAAARPAACGLEIEPLGRSGEGPAAVLDPRAAGPITVELASEPFSMPPVLAATEQLEQWLRRRPEIGWVHGPASHLAWLSFLLDPDDPAARAVPSTPAVASELWNKFRFVAGENGLRRLVEPESYAQGLVVALLPAATYADLARLLADLAVFAESTLGETRLSLRRGGDVMASQTMISAIVEAQKASLVVTFGLLGLLAAIFTRSVRGVCALLLAPSLAILASFGWMGWLGVPLGVATSMFAGITLGVGVDYSIHLWAAHRRLGGALADTLSEVGPALGIDLATVGLGFSLLLTSPIPANVRLASLLVGSLFICFLASLLLVPLLLRSAARPSAVLDPR